MKRGRFGQAVDRDPSGVLGGVAMLIAAVVALLVAFGVPISEEQTVAVLGFTTAAGPFVTAWLIRREAWAPESHWTQMSDMAVDIEGQISPEQMGHVGDIPGETGPLTDEIRGSTARP